MMDKDTNKVGMEHYEELMQLKRKQREIKQAIDQKCLEMAEAVYEPRSNRWMKTLYYELGVSSEILAKAFCSDKPLSVRKIVGSIDVQLYCSECDNPAGTTEATSKTSYNEAKRANALCPTCREVRDQKDAIARQEYQEQARQAATALEHLKTMPYSEYLQTDHWKGVRKRALRQAGHACSLCNAEGFLNVHHRTYENRGEEAYRDVIVLCSHCHAKFHDKIEQTN